MNTTQNIIEQSAESTIRDTSLRVNVNVLDKLMTLAGELVLTRNQLLQTISLSDLDEISKTSQKVDLVTTELQEAIMATRMQPVGIVFNRFKRIVHDMGQDLGKEIELELEGSEVELDKTIIEAIADPMTHLIRNAVDHGIESPDDRRKAGKPLPASLKVKAFHEAGQVLISVEDDGKGIDPEMIKTKALEQGLEEKARLDAMTDDELYKLILTPGFSLAEEVTDISGRGVGMDVVNTNLTKLGGNIDIKSRVGKGTSISVKLPLTLAIIPSLIVTAENEKFAIPQVNLVELVRIAPEQVKDKIELIDDASVIRLRGELLPLVRLSDALGIPRTFTTQDGEVFNDRRENIHDRRSKSWNENGKLLSPKKEKTKKRSDRRTHPDSAVNIVVVNAGELNFGIIVDTLLDSEEIVVKPLGKHMRDCKAYAGATILGNGRSALIIDVVGVRNSMGLRPVRETTRDNITLNRINESRNAQSLVVVNNALDEYFGVSLGLISRIEKIKPADMETVGGQLSMQYRGGSLPLFRIEDVANVAPIADKDSLFVIVFKYHGREVGVLASQIVDAIDVDVEFDDSTFTQPGILGSAIILEQTTMLLDLYKIVSSSANFNGNGPSEQPQLNQASVLIVEDSNFYRNHIKSFLEDAGCIVYEAVNGVQGLKVLESNADQINLVLTDIDMPEMDGFEMTEIIRGDDRYKDLPILACTSMSGELAEKRGYEVGLDEYLLKLDREQVLERISAYINK